MPVTLDRCESWTRANGVVIVFADKNAFGIDATASGLPLLKLEVDWRGRWYKQDLFDASQWYRDRLDVPLAECMVRVQEGDTILAQLGTQPQGHNWQPWMVWQGQQQHVTENYLSIPPALRIVDGAGALWTLGYLTAEPALAPRGEFGFNVLRNGLEIPGIVASRIECRNGQVRAFTRGGWRRWLGRSFS